MRRQKTPIPATEQAWTLAKCGFYVPFMNTMTIADLVGAPRGIPRDALVRIDTPNGPKHCGWGMATRVAGREGKMVRHVNQRNEVIHCGYSHRKHAQCRTSPNCRRPRRGRCPTARFQFHPTRTSSQFRSNCRQRVPCQTLRRTRRCRRCGYEPGPSRASDTPLPRVDPFSWRAARLRGTGEGRASHGNAETGRCCAGG